MNKRVTFFSGILLPASLLAGGMNDDPLIYKVMIEKLEIRESDEANPLVLDAEAWVGYDLNKFWFKTELERPGGETEEAEIQLLYSRAIFPFWDVQVGWRRDLIPDPERDWLAISLKGLAPYLFEVDASLFAGESGQIGVRLDAEYEYLFTQRLVLTPEIEVNLHTKDDEEVGIGSGLSDLSLGLQLRYEVKREFAPYIGVNWSKRFGDTADFAREEGEDVSDLQWLVGVRAWY
ncbi:MAG: copper resistance protein B [Candidatus Thiodiazotropha endolucinida]